MPNASYSVLLMRDDADVKTLRVSPRRLKLLLWLFGAATLLMLVGLGLGLRALVGYSGLRAERRALEVRLAEAQVELERLGNLDKIMHGGAPSPRAEQAAKTAEGPQAAHRAFARLRKDTLGVDNVKGSVSGDTLSVAFDLNSRAQGQSAGEITLFLLRNDGSLTQLEPANPAELTYQIQRFKRISVSARAPEGLTRREALGLRVEIKNADGEMILAETYALGS